MSAFKDFLADSGSVFTEEHWLEVSGPDGEVRRVQAFASEEYPIQKVKAKGTEFKEGRSFDGALFVENCARRVDYTFEETMQAVLKGSPLTKLFMKFWIVDDASLETQLEILSFLKYPEGEPEPERLAECQEILRKIDRIQTFKIWSVNPLLGAIFDNRLSEQQATEIAEIVQPFHQKNGDHMYSTVKSHARGIRHEFMM